MEQSQINYKIQLDPWQKEFLATKGDKILCCGRQIGKSVVCSIDAGEWAVANKDKTVLIIAPTERQAYELFEKTLVFLMDNYPKMIKKGKDRPTQTRIKLTNGSKIICLPVGISGIGVRGYTVGRLYADEAAPIPRQVWAAVTPMLLTTGGDTILLSTPSGDDNFFAEVLQNKQGAYDSFTRFQYNSEEVLRNRAICDTWTTFRRDKALEHIEKERKRMTKLQFAQEYEGQILSDLRRFFPADLIRARMTRDIHSEANYDAYRGIAGAALYLGVDVARMGSDDTVLVEVAKLTKKNCVMTDMQIYKKMYLTEIAKAIKTGNNLKKYKQIYVDDNGIGSGVLDILLEDNKTKRKTVGINNTTRSVDNEEKRSKKLLKEDLYNNLLKLMEDGRIELLNDPEVYQSLISIQVEFTEKGNLRIYGSYDHIAEALVRAAWCMKDKSLNIYVHYS